MYLDTYISWYDTYPDLSHDSTRQYFTVYLIKNEELFFHKGKIVKYVLFNDLNIKQLYLYTSSFHPSKFIFYFGNFRNI